MSNKKESTLIGLKVSVQVMVLIIRWICGPICFILILILWTFVYQILIEIILLVAGLNTLQPHDLIFLWLVQFITSFKGGYKS